MPELNAATDDHLVEITEMISILALPMYSFPSQGRVIFRLQKGMLSPLMSTLYHVKYFTHELIKRCPSDSIEKLASALVDAQVDLNPQQIEVADKVGLAKTIEAGLVLSQKCAERKQRVLVMIVARYRF